MKNALRKVVVGGGLLVLLSVAMALPREEEERRKGTRSPGVDEDGFPAYQEDQQEEFSLGKLLSGRVGKLLNELWQLPAAVFRFMSGVIAQQPFAKLREEVRNLNISYPK